MIDFETWWNSSSADEFRRLNDDMDGRVVRPVWDAAIRATLSSQKATSAAPSPEATQPTQAEAPSERARAWIDAAPTLTELAHQLQRKEAQIAELRVALATQQAVPSIPKELDVRTIMLDVVPGWDGMGHEVYATSVADVEAKLSKMGEELEDWQLGVKRLPQQAVQGEPVAFEFYNPTTGHAIVDYSRQTHVGPLTKEMGYEARPLGYINPPPAAMKPGDPVPLWQALEALDSLEESSRGDAPYNHFAAGLVRSALEQAATPPAPGQVERDREDGFETVLVKNFGPLIVALDRAERKGYLPDALADEWAAFELRAARSSEGGVA